MTQTLTRERKQKFLQILEMYYQDNPPTQEATDFNKEVKNICQACDINELMLGGITKVDKETGLKRKVIGMYPKYKLISSHAARRSFATNLLGKVPNQVIMDVAGWRLEKQMLAYNQATNLESAKILQKYWNEKY